MRYPLTLYPTIGSPVNRIEMTKDIENPIQYEVFGLPETEKALIGFGSEPRHPDLSTWRIRSTKRKAF